MLRNLPWFGLGFGLLLALLTRWADPLQATATPPLPVLAILFMSELGSLLSLAGVVIALRGQLAGQFRLLGLFTVLGNGLLLAYFLNYGMNLWMAMQA